MSCAGLYTRHWFAYAALVGSSAPRCQHHGCNAVNPSYDQDRDPFAHEAPEPEQPDPVWARLGAEWFGKLDGRIVAVARRDDLAADAAHRWRVRTYGGPGPSRFEFGSTRDEAYRALVRGPEEAAR